jgi:hypothetical protein
MPEVHLLQAFALLFLLPDVFPYHLLVSPSGVEPLICQTFAASPAERGNSYLGLWKGQLLGKDLKSRNSLSYRNWFEQGITVTLSRAGEIPAAFRTASPQVKIKGNSPIFYFECFD